MLNQIVTLAHGCHITANLNLGFIPLCSCPVEERWICFPRSSQQTFPTIPMFHKGCAPSHKTNTMARIMGFIGWPMSNSVHPDSRGQSQSLDPCRVRIRRIECGEEISKSHYSPSCHCPRLGLNFSCSENCNNFITNFFHLVLAHQSHIATRITFPACKSHHVTTIFNMFCLHL